MVKLVTAAELKPVVKLSSSCWVRLQSVVKLRGGGSLGLIRLGPGAGCNCDLFLQQLWPNHTIYKGLSWGFDESLFQTPLNWHWVFFNQQVEHWTKICFLSLLTRPRRQGTLPTRHTDLPRYKSCQRRELLYFCTFKTILPHCEFCFRILALSSRSVRASSSVTWAFMPIYIDFEHWRQ